tara:strand:+ start:7188 stop:8354 length:1167 start_codon:yes stop_codon:yes gene_type:complete
MKINKFTFEWDGLEDHLTKFNFSEHNGTSEKFVEVKLPEFVSNYNLNQNLLFPEKFVEPHNFQHIVVDYEKCNWLGAANYLASLEHEKNSVKNKILSNSNNLYSDEIYSKALVNRYLLFLRDFLAYKTKKSELIGKINKPKIILTHDVDAIKVSYSLKARQYIQNRKWPNLDIGEDINFIKEIVEMEKNYATNSIFFFNAAKKYLKVPFVDPSYKLSEVHQDLNFLHENNFITGLHPGIYSSFSKLALKSEVKNFTKYVNTNYLVVRNHWLSNFIEKTWKIQSQCNVKSDFSIGFNDRPGLRNLSLIEYRPTESLNLIPMILMDGQFYNYKKEDAENIIDLVKPYINELKNVGGVASFNLHQRFFHTFYGYKDLYKNLLEYFSKEGVL